MKRARILPLLLLVALCAPARAEFVSNAQLMAWLKEAVKQGGSFKDTTLVLGFVSGVHDSIPEGEVCLPDRQSARSMLPAILGWMETHRDTWDDNGALSVRRALTATYPCPIGGRP
ncbi:MAG: Rap1a/Tai family immunity protein [Burkholderiales bacterium]